MSSSPLFSHMAFLVLACPYLTLIFSTTVPGIAPMRTLLGEWNCGTCLPFFSFQFPRHVIVVCSLLHFVVHGSPSYGYGLCVMVMPSSFQNGILDCRQCPFISLVYYDFMYERNFKRFLAIEICKLKLNLVQQALHWPEAK